MKNLMRKMNAVTRCAAIYRTQNSSSRLPGIYHSYVFAVCNNPGWSQDKLAKHICTNKSNVTRHLCFLEDNGYIERRASEKDKRELLVYPTEKMLQMLPEVRKISKEWNDKVTCGIPEAELEIFDRILEKIREKSIEIVFNREAAE